MRTRLIAVAALTLAVTAAAVAGEETSGGGGVASRVDQVARYDGLFAYVGGDDDEQGRLDAIEEVVVQMSRLLRRVTRRRLTSATVIPRTYEIRVDGEMVTIAIDDGRAWTTDLDGTSYSFVHEGEPFEMQRRWVDGAIQADARQKVGDARYHFALGDDGRSLRVTYTIHSDWLPEPVVFSARFQRI